MTLPEQPVDPAAPKPSDPWSRQTRDRWFFGALAFSTIGVAYLFSRFMYVLLFACVVVVVTWPLYQRLLGAFRGRRPLAAGVTVLILVLVVFGPFSILVYLFVQEAIQVVGAAITYVQSGEITRWIHYLTTSVAWMPTWLQQWLPADFDLQDTVAGPLQNGALSVLDFAATAAPGLLGGTMNLGIDLVIFMFAVVSFYMEGPRILVVVKNLLPVDDTYEELLFRAFAELANNLVLGSVVTAAVQGFVAGVGYAIVGVDRVVFFAMLTGLFAFVPIVGTVAIWVPLAIATAMNDSMGHAVFLGVWGLGITQIDNLIRPLFLRGRTNIHPLLIFLAVFGGIGWFGLPGALIGPVMVVFFVALYAIYVQHYLGQPPPVLVAKDRNVPHWLARLGKRLRQASRPNPTPPVR